MKLIKHFPKILLAFIFPMILNIAIAEDLIKEEINTSSANKINQQKYKELQDTNIKLLEESKTNIELASKIIDWSAMIFSALAVLFIIAGAVGLREFSNFKNIKEEMSEEISKIRSEIIQIQSTRQEVQDELSLLKNKLRKESGDIFKTIYLLNEAISSFNTGSLQHAINMLTDILTINPNDYEATCLLARCYSGQEKHEKAIDIAQLAVSLSVTPYRAFYIMAESYRRMEKYDNAIEQHKKSLELAKRAPTQNSLAYCYYKKKNFITAETEFRKSLEISRNPTAVIGVAKSLLMQDNYEKACEYCHEGVVLTKEEIERGTTLVWSYYNIATAYLILNKKEKCIEAINKSILITSKNRAQIREQVYDYELMANNENINQDLAKECIDLWKIAI